MSSDDARTKEALRAYQDAMRRCQTWRAAVRAALAAADAITAKAEADTATTWVIDLITVGTIPETKKAEIETALRSVSVTVKWPS